MPLLLISIILIGIPTDFKADMFVIEGVSGTDFDEGNEPLEISGHHTDIFVPTNPLNPHSNQFTSTPDAFGSFINPLTGLPTANDISRNRPVAISISNARSALPANSINGISQADIVYELLVESGITRFLGLYQDFSHVGVVGSIRSARHYMVEIVEAYNAMFIHAGGSPLGFEEIDNRGITNFDAVLGLRADIFTRDVHRIHGYTVDNYHALITSGSAFARYLPSYDIQLMHDNHFRQSLRFRSNPMHFGDRAHRATIRFSPGKESAFNYNAADDLYYMTQFGSQLTDANNGASVAFTNLLILHMPIADLVGHGEGAGRQDMNTIGMGTGYFASGGRYIPIFWFRASKSAQYLYTDLNGTELELAPGKTYIALVPPSMTTSFS